MKYKYNWKQLKKEYMLGDIVSVRAFCRYKDVPYNRNTQKQTIGWRAEKEAMERKKNGKNDRKSH